MSQSRFILALDFPVKREILEGLSPKVHGLKVGLGLTLDLGIQGVKDLLKGLDVEEIVVDFKLADIAPIMQGIASRLSFADSFIAHSVIGSKGALLDLKRFLDVNGKKLYLLGAMSHEGWDDSLNWYTTKVILDVDPFGIVAPATRGKVISQFREKFPSKVIISPGVGTQGAPFGSAICNGATYEIVGRSIFSSGDPLNNLKFISENQEREVLNCKGTKAGKQ
ncbi:orotidine 5'-phosphate decarboxylase [Sulfuracidifex metallicus]|uniref:orotidine 5'-phosphate decarboxylase n=1 Tax=Sulfuracidifex metallicus TaxID=47303 RepID=UPI0022737043|nr:orotidine 5'-phosphate decarboxylase [Sulfuracidifex metallicus]MCY0849923.1 orotidine 5'-phosphate decarboxylase [Sulfuracidifex metallicus]